MWRTAVGACSPRRRVPVGAFQFGRCEDPTQRTISKAGPSTNEGRNVAPAFRRDKRFRAELEPTAHCGEGCRAPRLDRFVIGAAAPPPCLRCLPASASFQEAMREAHVPAQQSEAQQDPRLPPAYADQGRPSGDPEPPSAGPQASRGLIWPVRDRATFESFAQARPRKAGPVRIRQVRGGPGPPRVAYAIGTRAGNAVARNRLRRRLRAAIRDQAALLEPGSAYLVSAESQAATMSYVALCEAIGRALSSEGTGR